jgi:hypothetical protein
VKPGWKSTREMGSTKVRTVPKTAFKIGCVYVTLLLAIEGVGRIAIWYLESRNTSGFGAENIISNGEPLLGFALKKNVSESMGRWKVHTDQWGFRDNGNSLTSSKPADEYRIFVVGGSTVFGWGVEDDQSIPAHLQKMVDSHFSKGTVPSNKHVRVINAGVPWYASWHEAAYVFFRILEFKPDWIIVVDGLNDSAMGVSPTWAPMYQGFIDLPTRLAYEGREKRPSLLQAALNLSPSFRYFHARFKARELSREGVFHPEVWDQYFTYMNRLSTLAKSSAVRFSIYFQPVMHLDKPLQYFEKTHDGTSMAVPKFAENFTKQYLAGESRGLSTKDLPFTSLRKAFAGSNDWLYLDGLHYTNEGNQILARLIFEREVSAVVTDLLSHPSLISSN